MVVILSIPILPFIETCLARIVMQSTTDFDQTINFIARKERTWVERRKIIFGSEQLFSILVTKYTTQLNQLGWLERPLIVYPHFLSFEPIKPMVSYSPYPSHLFSFEGITEYYFNTARNTNIIASHLLDYLVSKRYVSSSIVAYIVINTHMYIRMHARSLVHMHIW